MHKGVSAATAVKHLLSLLVGDGARRWGRVPAFIEGPITKLVPFLSPVYRAAAGSHGDVALFTATTSSPSTRLHCKVALFSLQNNPPSLNLLSPPEV